MIRDILKKNRRIVFLGFPSLVILVTLIICLFTGRYVSTDDAYVKAANVAINCQVAGQVADIYVHDNQQVTRGTLLFKLDDRPYKLAAEQAKQALKKARLNIQALKYTYAAASADVKAAQDLLNYQQRELNRQRKMATAGVSSQRHLDRAKNSFNQANQVFKSLQEKEAGLLAQLNHNPNISVDKHPVVKQAKANLRLARLNLSYTVVTAPSSGVVTKVNQLQVGDYVRAGEPVWSLISRDDVWVQANFKETQTTYIQAGQNVTVFIDALPQKKLSETVVSISPGTGSTFSLLPPENATGNWVKIVQRIPVRISLHSPELKGKLRSGMSGEVTVDTGKEHRHL